jgi:hypothetical protein
LMDVRKESEGKKQMAQMKGEEECFWRSLLWSKAIRFCLFDFRFRGGLYKGAFSPPPSFFHGMHHRRSHETKTSQTKSPLPSKPTQNNPQPTVLVRPSAFQSPKQPPSPPQASIHPLPPLFHSLLPPKRYILPPATTRPLPLPPLGPRHNGHRRIRPLLPLTLRLLLFLLRRPLLALLQQALLGGEEGEGQVGSFLISRTEVPSPSPYPCKHTHTYTHSHPPTRLRSIPFVPSPMHTRATCAPTRHHLPP